MKLQIFSVLRLLLLILISIAFVLSLQSNQLNAQSVRASTIDTVCRFGITSPSGSEGYDIASLGVGSYLDWGAGTVPSLPAGVEYIRVLRLRDDLYLATSSNLTSMVQAHLGSVWAVGNEPDTTYGGQDALLPETYADRFFDLATIIRQQDPSARIGFGSIVQPTPIRLRYLDRAWQRLVDRAGSTAGASGLIDFWSIHSFILNEEPGSWGTGIPPGFDVDDGGYIVITPDQTYSIDTFQQRLTAFRTWMAGKGERDKPLWITEYGSLMPPIDPPGGPDYYNVSDQDTTDFMLATFNFMLISTDALTGLPADGNKLVQRWFWYSLNDYRYNFGGSVFDPANEKTITVVGAAFRDYQPLGLAQPDLFPASFSIVPFSYSNDRSRVNYRLYLRIGNAFSADIGSSAQVWIYDGDPQVGGTLIAGPISSALVQRCGGSRIITANWLEVEPLTDHILYVQVEPVGVVDSNPANNLASFSVYGDLPKVLFLPSVYR